MENSESEILNKIDFHLAELLKLMKIVSFEIVKNRLNEILDTKEKQSAYENTDGSITVRELGKIIGVDKSTISKWWNEWGKSGIVEPGPNRNDRPIKVFSLKDFGID